MNALFQTFLGGAPCACALAATLLTAVSLAGAPFAAANDGAMMDGSGDGGYDGGGFDWPGLENMLEGITANLTPDDGGYQPADQPADFSGATDDSECSPI